MVMSNTVTSYLDKRDITYELVPHRRSVTAGESASRAHVPRQRVAKGVLFCDDTSYVLAVAPASHRIDVRALATLLKTRELTLAGEDELVLMFPDCEIGAVPVIGAPYGVATVVDAALLTESEVYLELGDHQHLVRVDGNEFRRLMHGVPRGVISRRAMRLKVGPSGDLSLSR